MKLHRSARPCSAFTLVELLVVIGIIALLISILLPALNSARRSANAVKCAAALREIGNCFVMYASDNRGYLPPTRLNKYEYDGVFYDSNGTENLATTPAQIKTHMYWYNFLSKYITKVRGGTMSKQDDDGGRAKRTLIWGCPNFTPYPVALTNPENQIGDTNRLYTGYGMNNWPTFKPDHPATGTDFPGDPGAGGSAREEFIGVGTPAWPPTWYKITQYTRPGERALAGDSVWWSLESRAPNAAGDNMTCHNYEFNSGGMTGARGSGQTNCDLFRHGKPPALKQTGQSGMFETTGGKVAYNVLYADNHVTTETERKAIYRATRMRFPQ